MEDGEDLNAALSSYLLKHTGLKLGLNVVMQPYNPKLRAIIEQGGYHPIVPSLDAEGSPIYKVLLHIEGWEPTREDLYRIFVRHAYDRGITWPFHKAESGIHRLRDIVDLKAKLQATSSNWESDSQQDTGLSGSESMEANGDAKESISQIVMNRVYNRWVLEFTEEEAAKRFARLWHRRVLPTPRLVT